MQFRHKPGRAGKHGHDGSLNPGRGFASLRTVRMDALPGNTPAAPRSEGPGGAGQFRTTHWSLVAQAGQSGEGDAHAALDQLCRGYWPPVYAFIRRRGHSPHEAEDLTQGFFERVLAKSYLESADREKGRFRTFLITLLIRYLANEWDRRQRLKRGGGLHFVSLDAGEAEEQSPIEPATQRTPEMEYERRWAETLLDRVIKALSAEYEGAGLSERFATLKVFLVDAKGTLPLGEAGTRLGLSEAAVKSAVYRLRTRYREILREEISHTVSRPEDVDEELRHLFSALSN
ncbi:MAG: RNA polymerase sigma factor [Verrucomicrobiales bacterium]|nr:RNA polymerase sigma factor [Verrucomicrobiales bacterium]